MKQPSFAAGRARGFTLIEMIVAIAIMAVLVGAAVPVTSKILTYKARKATREELQTLSDASAEFFRDTHRLPTAVGELLADPGDAGWSGPYLPGVVTDQVSGRSGYEVDAWSRTYQLSVSGDVLDITSGGEDAAFGDTTDLAIELNVTWIRREETLAELKVLNQAITLYNGQYQALAPLSTHWSTALGQLVSKGLLPSGAGYDVDGWGVPYVADPPGLAPLVKIGSASISPETLSLAPAAGTLTSPGTATAAPTAVRPKRTTKKR